MNITFHRRAEIALRSLDLKEQQQITQVVKKLIAVNNPNENFVKTKLHKLATKSPMSLYSYRGNNRLKLIISIDNNEWVVEDIIDRDRFEQLPIAH